MHGKTGKKLCVGMYGRSKGLDNTTASKVMATAAIFFINV